MKWAARIAVALALALAGCAQPSTWVKSGASAQDYATDSYECEKDARQSGYFGTGLVGAVNMSQFAQRCMIAHGWQLVRSNAEPPVPDEPATECGAIARAAPGGALEYERAYHQCQHDRGAPE